MVEMSSKERVMLALQGKKPDRVPVILFPRYIATRYAGYKFGETIVDPEKYVNAQILAQRRFQYDSVHDYNMMGPVEEAMGVKLKYPEDDAPSVEVPLIKTRDDLAKIRKVDPYKDGLCPKVLWTIRQLKQKVMEKGEPKVPVITWGSCPSRTAGILMGFTNWFMLTRKDPQMAVDLMEACLKPWLNMVVAEVEAGADVVWVNDPVSSADCISRDTYEKYTQPYEKKFILAIRERTGVPVIFHPCGNWHDRLDLVAANGADAMFPGTMDLDLVIKKSKGVGNMKAIVGNVGAVTPCTTDGRNRAEAATTMLLGKPEEIEAEAKRDIALGMAEMPGYILGSNCFPSPDTPTISTDTVVYAARKYGVYPKA